MNDAMMTSMMNGTMKSKTIATPRWEIDKRGKIRKKAMRPAGKNDKRILTIHLNWNVARCAWHMTCR